MTLLDKNSVVVFVVISAHNHFGNPGRFGPGSFRHGSFRPIFRVGRFGLSRWVASAHFRGVLFWPWVVSAKVYRNYYGMTRTDRRLLSLVTIF